MTDADHNSSDSLLCCLDCGYDLRGLASLRCPECGREHTEAEFAEAGGYETRVVDPTVFTCSLIPAAVLAAFAGIAMLGMRFDSPAIALPGLIGAVITAGPVFLVTAWIGARVNTQFDLVGAAEPSAFRLHPAKARLLHFSYVFVYYLWQIILSICFIAVGGIAISILFVVALAIR